MISSLITFVEHLLSVVSFERVPEFFYLCQRQLLAAGQELLEISSSMFLDLILEVSLYYF